MGMDSWRKAVKPLKIFGRTFTICHLLPAVVALLGAAVLSFPSLAILSHYSPPVVLHSIWMEPNSFSASAVARGEAEFTLVKSGGWLRLCQVDAKQTYIDEKGTIRFIGPTHAVNVPPSFERMAGKGRPKMDTLPKVLGGSPGKWRLQLVNLNGACWSWERWLWPIIATEPVEATFEITE